MAVLRKEKRSSYTVIDNEIFKDSSLSFKAKGLLCQMLSLPDDWEYSVSGLAKLTSDKTSAITSGLKELTAAGYFRREQRYKGGKFAGYEYVISETKKRDFTFSENPITENTKTENTITENQAQLNTKESNTNKSITNASKKEIYTEFDNLWILYPRKQGKDKALSYYDKARKTGTTYEEVENGIKAYIQYLNDNDIEPQFIKQGSTFFSQKAWMDDWSMRKKPNSGNPYYDMWQEGDYQ